MGSKHHVSWLDRRGMRLWQYSSYIHFLQDKGSGYALVRKHAAVMLCNKVSTSLAMHVPLGGPIPKECLCQSLRKRAQQIDKVASSFPKALRIC
eukprot:12916199-Prorocentrum_lima.AAC.1